MRLDEAMLQNADWWAREAKLTRMDAILAVRRLTAWMDAAMGTFGAPAPAAAA